MQGGFRCKIDYFLSSLKCYIKEHKRLLLCYTAAILCGLILGIIVTSLRENVKSKFNYIVLISNEQYNLFGTFIQVILLSLVGVIICYLQIYHKYCVCLPYIVLFYTAYRFGGRMVGIIIADKFVGFICIITFTIPIYLSILVAFLSVACLCEYYRATCGGRGLVCRKTNRLIIKRMCCIYGGLLAVLFVVCIIVPAIAKFIIIV